MPVKKTVEARLEPTTNSLGLSLLRTKQNEHIQFYLGPQEQLMNLMIRKSIQFI